MTDVVIVKKGSIDTDGTEQIEIPVRYVANNDGSYSLKVETGGVSQSTGDATLAEQQNQTTLLQDIKTGVEQVGVHRYPTTTVYEAAVNFTGATAGDTIHNITIVDTSNNSVIADVWVNKRTGLTLANAPTVGTEVIYVAGTALTNAELRLTPVPMSLDQTNYTDVSTTIISGGVAQQVVAADSSRKGVLIQNISDTDMYINTTGTATTSAGSFLLKASGGTYETSKGAKDSQAISILCATTGKAFTAKWW